MKFGAQDKTMKAQPKRLGRRLQFHSQQRNADKKLQMLHIV